MNLLIEIITISCVGIETAIGSKTFILATDNENNNATSNTTSI
jgi:hypothetical protein